MNKNSSILKDTKLSLNVQHLAIEDYESLIQFINHSALNSLNISDEDLFKLRVLFVVYVLIQFSCCLILLVLNNWDTIVYRARLKRTLSVDEFVRKVELEKSTSSYLRKIIRREKESTAKNEDERGKSHLNDDKNIDIDKSSYFGFRLSQPESFLRLITYDEQRDSIFVPFYSTSFTQRRVNNDKG